VPIVPEAPIRMSILSCPAHLPVVRSAVDQFSRLVGFGDDAASSVVMAVDEALANIIQHAYDGRPDGPIEVTLQARTHNGRQVGMEVILADRGRGAQPDFRPRDLADVRPGGLGTHIMAVCMDSVDYAPRSGGGTCLTMVKHLPAGKVGPETGEQSGE
jgi:anti-sigma regulatory factor (Ser/Thr protein kinase)